MFSIKELRVQRLQKLRCCVGRAVKQKSLVFSTKSIQSIYRLKMEENLTFRTQTFSQSKIFDGG